MTFLAPGWILMAAVASTAIVAIHLIAWQLPRAVSLPTARFVPDEPARRAARTIRPSDLALMALRVAIVMAGGMAMAHPVMAPRPSGTATVIAVERPAATGLRDSLGGISRGDRTVFVVFDSAARVYTDEPSALGDAERPDPASGASVTVGLLGAVREGHRLSRDYASVDLVVISSFARSSIDAATVAVRDLWPDSIRVVRLPAEAAVPTPASVELSAGDDDPVVAGIRLAQSNGLVRGTSRVVRSVATAADTASADAGAALVLWPRAERSDTGRVDGVHVDGATALAHFVHATLPDSGRVVARWIDGSAAAREVPRGAGCIRTIGFDLPDAGDFVLTPAFQRLASALLARCGVAPAEGVAADSMLVRLAAPPRQVTVPATDHDGGASNRLAATLMALAVLLALAELVIRRRGVGASRMAPGVTA